MNSHDRGERGRLRRPLPGRIALARDRVAEFMARHLVDETNRCPEVSLTMLPTERTAEVGFRLAEAAAWWPTEPASPNGLGHGLSFAESDQNAAPVLLAAERLALAWLRGDDEDDIADWAGRLARLLAQARDLGRSSYLETWDPGSKDSAGQHFLAPATASSGSSQSLEPAE